LKEYKSMNHLKYILSILYCLQIFIANAEKHPTKINASTNNIAATSHSLLAPEGIRYQWYLNTLKIDGATAQELEVTDAGIYKLEMTDVHGNILEKQTIIGLTSSGAIIRIFTIGDSTVQDYTAGYYPRKGWGQVLPVFFNATNVTVINKAVGGTSSKSFYNSFWADVRDNLQAGDFVFIQFGINDRNNADPARYTPTGGEFESYLTKYVNETKAKSAFPVLIATLRRNAWNADGTVYDAYHDHPVATRTVAKSLGVPLIDLDAKAKVLLESLGETYATRLLYNNYEGGEYPNYPNGNADNVHFQEMGAIEMAKLVTQSIRELGTDINVKKLIPFLKPEYQIAVAVNPMGSDIVTTHTTTYPQGLTITLKTIPKTANTFQKWNNASGAQLSTAVLTTVTSGTAATSYTAIYKGATACIASISTTTSTTFCAGGSVVLTASSGSSYKWFNGATQVGTAATYTATATGSYTVEVTNASGCKATSTAKEITVYALPVITPYIKIDAGAWISSLTVSACETGTINFGPQPNLAAGWSWTGPNNFTSTLRNPVLPSVTTANAGSYTATYTDVNGCKVNSTLILQIIKPTATITASAASFCAGSSVILTASTGTSYKWFNGTTQVGTAATYTATAAGSYTVEVTNASGCKAMSDVLHLTGSTQQTPTIVASSNTICPGGSVLLTSSAGSSYKWFNGTTQVGTAATYTAAAVGSYTVEVTNASGCKAMSAVLHLTGSAQQTPTIVSSSNTICPGRSVLLTSSIGSSYKWFNGTTQVGTAATYTATAVGSYTVEVTNSSGCKATSAVLQLTGSAQQTPTIVSSSNTICSSESVLLTSSTGSSYKWFNGTTQVGTAATYTATAAGSYTVEVTNASGCKVMSEAKEITTILPSIWYADTDNDGEGDPGISITDCSKPTGYVSSPEDGCPDDANKIYAGNCGCGNTELSCLDCAGTYNGTAYIDNCSICVEGITGNSACVPTATTDQSTTDEYLIIYPQPFNTTITISLKNKIIKSVTFINSAGIISEYQGHNTSEIQLGESLASGFYIALIETETATYTKKVIKL